jgi:aspartyl-tRNA synthetase
MFDFRRTHTCADLTISHVGEKVTLSGWVHRRRDLGKIIFVDLRDRFGITQLVIDSSLSQKAYEQAEKIRQEWVISLKGSVTKRKDPHPSLPTGEIEVIVEELEILSDAKNPPFSISDERIEINEELRLKYRYLDLRRKEIMSNLIMRHKAMMAIRTFMDKSGFIEVSTPILCKSTPEGARDYLVPSRVYPGNFYALPQSPQIFKQLLMLGGLDRYFQIASCFRDEDLRADRQPEFTQIDIEMSFLTPKELFAIVERLVQHVFQECLGVSIPSPFQQMSHKEALESYGTDKPDLRFGMPLVRIDEIAEQSSFPIFQEVLSKGGSIKALCIKKGADISRKSLEEYEKVVLSFGIEKIFSLKKGLDGFSTGISKYFDPKLQEQLTKKLSIENGDLVVIAAEKEERVNQGLDHLRRAIGKERNLIDKNSWKFLWVQDFPLFSKDKETGEIQSEHHPFTSPHFEDLHLLDTHPLKARAFAYDLVLNGYELASGSQRIHNGEMQKKIFSLIKLKEEEIESRFGYFIEALRYGTPPHLGCALGFDRLLMLLCKTENIRDVIAFPKTQKASDLMMQSPSSVSVYQLKELHLQPTETYEIRWP